MRETWMNESEEEEGTERKGREVMDREGLWMQCVDREGLKDVELGRQAQTDNTDGQADRHTTEKRKE